MFCNGRHFTCINIPILIAQTHHSCTNSSKQEPAKGFSSPQYLSCKHHWNHQTFWLVRVTSALWRTVFQTEFLLCPLLEIGGILYISHAKGHRIVSFPTLIFSSLVFYPWILWAETRETAVWFYLIAIHIYTYTCCDLGHQRNVHLVLSSMANWCINPWWKIMRRLLRIWQLEHKPWISYRV